MLPIATLTIEMAAGVARLKADMDKALRLVGDATQNMQKAASAAGVALGGIAGALSARELLQMSDAVTQLNNRLYLATGSAKDAARSYDQLFQVAQRSRVDFVELGTTYSSIARATKDMGVSQSTLMTVTEAIGNAMTISGGSAESMKAALVQLGQGMASGVLRGEELNSIMEQTPRLAQAIADGLGITLGKLREYGKEGKLTSEAVINALQNQASVLSGEVQNATLTVAQAMTTAKNSAVNFVGAIDASTGASGGLAGVVVALSGSVDTLSTSFTKSHADATGLGEILGGPFSTILETLAVLAVNVSYVFKQVGNEIGGITAQAVAFLSLDFARAGDIGRMMKADAASARSEVEATTKRILTSREVAASLVGAKGFDEPRFTRAMSGYSASAGSLVPKIAGIGKAASKAKSEFDKLRESLEKSAIKGAADAQAATNGYTDSQSKALEIFASKEWGTFSEKQRLIITGLLEQSINAELAKNAVKALAEAQKDTHSSYASMMQAYSDSAISAEKRLADMQQEAEALALSESWQISMAQAVEYTTIARLKEKQVAAMGNEEMVAALQKEIDAREKIIGQLGQKEAKEKIKANEAAAGKVQDEWQKTWDNVQSGFVDAMMQGGDSVMNWLKDSFKKLVLQPLLSPMGGGGGLGDMLSGGGGAMDGLGKLWDFMSGKGMGKLETGVEALATKFGVAGDSAKLLGKAAGYAGNAMASYQMHSTISGGYKLGNGKAMDAVSAVAGAAFGPIAGVVTGLLNRAFGRKLTETGVKAKFDGAGGVSASNYEFYKGGLFRSDKTKTSKMPGADKFEDQLRNLQEGTARMAEALGMSGESVRKFAGELKINLMGLSDEEAAKKIQEELVNLRARMLELVPGMERFAEAGETLNDAMKRLVVETDEAMAKAGISSQAISDVIIQGMTGRLTGAQVGEQLSDIIIGGIYNTIAGGFAQQISDVFMSQIMTPIMTAITAGVPITEAISQAAIDKVVETATKAAAALEILFNDEGFQSAIERLKGAIGGISIATAGAAPYVNSFAGSVGNAGNEAEDAAQRIRDAWRDMGDTLTDEIRRIKGEIVGDTSGGLAYTQAQFAIATAKARAGDLEAAKMLPELSRALIELAQGSASSLSDLRVMQGSTASSLIETRRILAQKYGFQVPAYAAGTDYVPRDMLAQIHEGEQIVPKAYNPANGYNNNSELVDEVRSLRAEVASLRGVSQLIANATQNTDSTLNRVTQGGEALLTEAA